MTSSISGHIRGDVFCRKFECVRDGATPDSPGHDNGCAPTHRVTAGPRVGQLPARPQRQRMDRSGNWMGTSIVR
jgi:hypothetical protein